MLTKRRSGVFALDAMKPGQRGQCKAICKILAFDIFLSFFFEREG